jgi:hypothetical protein
MIRTDRIPPSAMTTAPHGPPRPTLQPIPWIQLKIMPTFQVLVYRGIRDGWQPAISGGHSFDDADRKRKLISRIRPNLIFKISQAY